jgi:curli production assembly/transport component CsgF
MRSLLILLPLVAASYSAQASEMLYEPYNPSFGGSPLNGSYLLSSATTQRAYTAPVAPKTSALDNFEETITRSILGRVSTQIAEAIYGEEAQDAGTFLVGDTRINFTRANGTVNVTIIDNLTGQQTDLTLPDTTL